MPLAERLHDRLFVARTAARHDSPADAKQWKDVPGKRKLLER
jgi:hypothetical protein